MITQALQTRFSPLVPVSSLENYIHYANKIPMLTQEEELSLAERLFYQQDLTAAKALILPHLRYVIKIAKGYAGYGLALGDLIQEGNIGLMKAVKRFDPGIGVRLVSFAVHWIKSEIHEFILKNWRIVKVATTKAQRKLFFNLRKMKKRLGWLTKQEVHDVAQDLGVKPEEVVQMEARLNATDAAFDGAANDADSPSYETDFSPAQYLEDTRFSPERLVSEERNESADREALFTALNTLDDRAKEILTARWLSNEKATLHELAARLNVSAERIRQIEKSAMDKIKAILLEKAA